jgi:hypothetical protein
MGIALSCCRKPDPHAIREIPESVFLEARGLNNAADNPHAPFFRPQRPRSDGPPTFDTEIDFLISTLSSDDDGPDSELLLL